MASRSKYKIDKVLIEICESKDINIKPIIKQATQLIHTFNMFIDENLEDVLVTVIDLYKDYTISPLTNEYVEINIKITENQKKSFQKINSKNRVNILNEIISIAINNIKDTQIKLKDRTINKHPIISNFTLKLFRNKDYEEDNTNFIEDILKKLRTILDTQAITESRFEILIEEVFKYFNVDESFLKILNNYSVAQFLHEEFGKIYFIMNYEYNMDLQNKSKYLRSFKPHYLKILEEYYDNDQNKFIDSELNLYKDKNLSETAEEVILANFTKDLLIENSSEFEFFDPSQIQFDTIAIINY